MTTLRTKQSAFTIVELLIVIVVIGILAAITVVAYNGIQQRARTSAATSALTQAAKKIKLWQVDSGDTAPDCAKFYELITGATTATSCSFSSGDIAYQYTQGTGSAYCMTATSATVSYTATETNQPTQGGCLGHGQGGNPAITNLVLNPSFETNANNWGAVSASGTRDAIGATNGSYSFKVTPAGTSTDSFGVLGSASIIPAGLSGGKTYTVSGTIYLPAPLTGTLDTRQRGITVYSWLNGNATGLGQSSLPPNSAGSTRVSLTFTVPSSITGLQIRFYNGATNSAANPVYWDAIMINEGSTVYSYADGYSSNWVWNGTPYNASSTGPASN
jgi:prepilin-type N-terminal cleavage/methylation domain-containing protein